MSAKTVAIVSDNLAGFILAARLERAGLKTILIHTGDGSTDSLLKPLLNRQTLSYFPAADALRSALKDLGDLCGQKLFGESHSDSNGDSGSHSDVIELPLLTFTENALKPFVGFGEAKNPAVQILSKYNVTQRLNVTSELPQHLAALLNGIQGQRYNFVELNEFNFDGETIDKLKVNVGQEISADHFVFMNSPQMLLNLLPSELVGARTRSRIAKTPVFTEVALVLEHAAPLLTNENLIFLTQSNDQLEPCVGQCLGPYIGQATQPEAGGELLPRFRSVWLTYIKEELCEDAEYVSTVIRNMRRQIRKAFSLSVEPATVFLTVTNQASADFSWLGEQKDIELIAKNLTIVPAFSSRFTGVAQSIDSAAAASAQIYRIIVDLGWRHMLDLPL